MRTLTSTKVPNTYSHVMLSLATTDTAKTSTATVGSISTILLPYPGLQAVTSQSSRAFWPISRMISHPHPSSEAR